MNLSSLEKTGDKFNLDLFFQARELCMKTVESVISMIQPGFTERQIQDLFKQSFLEVGITHFWHPTQVRISSDTIKNFRETSDPELKCVAGDICFVDLGPIIMDHEADYGRTFTVGSDKKNPLIIASHEIFEKTAQAWKTTGLTGIELFEFAQKLAQSYGYQLNSNMAGHRVGDFPHKIYSSQKLFELDAVPSDLLWVLEIHLIDINNSRGAFFEDILMK